MSARDCEGGEMKVCRAVDPGTPPRRGVLRLRIYESKASVVTGRHGERRCLSDERTGGGGQFFDWLS